MSIEVQSYPLGGASCLYFLLSNLKPIEIQSYPLGGASRLYFLLSNRVSFKVKNSRLAEIQALKGTPFEIFSGTSRPMRSQYSELSTNEKPRFRPYSWCWPNLESTNPTQMCQLTDTRVSLECQWNTNGLPLECQLTGNLMLIDIQ